MEKQKTRTEYSARNTGVAIGARILAILMGFFTRIVFTHTLSAEYVGVNGLFTDILNVLALSEMGVGTAITFALYKPIAESDTEKQKSLMHIYSIFYRWVAAIVAVAGLFLVPFLPYLMKDKPNIPGLTVIYLMYLANSVLSYFMIYKKTLIEASQQSYIDVLFHTFFLLLQNIIQIVILLTTGNFILFLAALIICTLAYNYSISKKAEKMFPLLKDNHVKSLPEWEKKAVFQNVRSMMMHKIGNVLVNNTDNLLLARLVSSIAVGCYSNYYLIIGSVRQVLNQAFSGIAASVGNLGVSEDAEHVRNIYNAALLAGVWMYGYAAIALYLVIDPFIGFCFGKSYVFNSEVTLVLCINFFLIGVREPSMVFRDSMGLFKYDRWVSLIEALANLLLSILLGVNYGIIGVFLGTLISTLLISFWVEPVILFKHKLNVSPIPYFLRITSYTCLTGLLAMAEKLAFTKWQVVNTDTQSGRGLLLAFLLRLIACTIVTNFVYFIVLSKTKAFKTLCAKLLFILEKRKEMRTVQYQESKMNNKNDDVKYKGLDPEEIWLLEALKESLTGHNSQYKYTEEFDLLKALNLTVAHSVPQLIEEQAKSLAKQSNNPAEAGLFREIQEINANLTLHAMRQIFLTKKLVAAFEQAGIEIVILKGIATGRYYGKPEKRKSGDVDFLLLESERIDEAIEIVRALGCEIKEDQRALHHIAFTYLKTSITIEMHTMLAEPFDNRRINSYVDGLIDECACHVAYVDAFGVSIPSLTGAFHAYELLIHMLQHFLRAGFGLKLLCDWVVFWNIESFSLEEKELYLRLVTESGVKGFSDMVTLLCIDYLGLQEKQVNFMDLTDSRKKMDTKAMLMDIFAGEEFGHADKNRMVALRGDGLGDYAREFHHQMKLNHPKSSKIVVLWPALWVITLIVFMRNNRCIRNTNSIEIYKKAGRRGKIVKQMGLFR